MTMIAIERKGWCLSWLVLLATLLAALPAIFVSQILPIPVLCLFLAGFGLARRRFTPALATVVVATSTIMLSPLGEAMFAPRSYEPYDVYEIPANLRQVMDERRRLGEPVDPPLRQRIREESVRTGTDVNRGIVFIAAIVVLAYVAVFAGAAVGIRRSRRSHMAAGSGS
ncbi:MAG: hypothetical protein OXH52_00065 [Gammaproteobacteria bacterium]|nr:hypothetical protein [Gammaproteobacteria bacterium]